ncbi:MAG: hypothetical protein WBA93_05445 [Microcoleaceae cyanobacterium]
MSVEVEPTQVKQQSQLLKKSKKKRVRNSEETSELRTQERELTDWEKSYDNHIRFFQKYRFGKGLKKAVPICSKHLSNWYYIKSV